jgi:hypothetical protein
MSVAAGLLLTVVAAPSAGVEARPDARVADALRILHAWDAARAAAYVRADPVTLRALYLPDSTAADADVRILRRYTARGVRVGWLATQVFAVRVTERTATRLRLRVVDRVVGAAAAPARCVRLPLEPPTRRVVELRWDGARWRVAAVSPR